jgi:hypothetical protein
MSKWHKNWQNNFEETEIHIGNRYADAVVNDIVIEFQHSRITKELVDKRKKNYENNNKKLYWIIDCNERIKYEKLLNENYMITFNNEWIYKNFISHDFIFLNIEEKIFKINPNDVKSKMLDVCEYKTEEEFLKFIFSNKNTWSDKKLNQCNLYHNQFGAGCGKTYESIQLIQEDNRFQHKTKFIYLTKLHSAREVIFDELICQLNNNKLPNITLDNVNDLKENNNKYIIPYFNKKTKLNCKMIIGTIDSFMSCIKKYMYDDIEVMDKDFFSGITKMIRDNDI